MWKGNGVEALRGNELYLDPFGAGLAGILHVFRGLLTWTRGHPWCWFLFLFTN